MNKIIDELISKGSVAINNGINQEVIAALLLQYGYTPERMAVGKGLLTTTVTLNNKQVKQNGEQKAATTALNQSISDANTVYLPQFKVSRIVFRDDVLRWTELELKGDRQTTHAGWLSQTKVFYNNLTNDEVAVVKMNDYGQTEEKLNAGLLLVEDVEEKLALRKKEMGLAQDATEERDKAADVLRSWYSDYIKIARLALADHPQYLEMLGIISA